MLGIQSSSENPPEHEEYLLTGSQEYLLTGSQECSPMAHYENCNGKTEVVGDISVQTKATKRSKSKAVIFNRFVVNWVRAV